jgi:MFS family permease
LIIFLKYSAFLVCDRIGRIWATRQLCLIWIIGAAIFMANKGNLGAVYAGRFVAGLGVGQTVVVAPVYLAEIVSSHMTAARWEGGCVTTIQSLERD